MAYDLKGYRVATYDGFEGVAVKTNGDMVLIRLDSGDYLEEVPRSAVAVLPKYREGDILYHGGAQVEVLRVFPAGPLNPPTYALRSDSWGDIRYAIESQLSESKEESQ